MAVGYCVKKGHRVYTDIKIRTLRLRNSKAPRISRGRVIDKEKDICKNRKRGLFMYALSADEYRMLPADYPVLPARREKEYRDRELPEVEFGSIFWHVYRKT